MAKTKKVLVVEDEDSLIFVLTKTINKYGLDVDSAKTIDEAKRLLASNDYLAHFLDIRLPDGDGVDLLSRIVAEGRSGASIVMTAEGTMVNAIRAVKKGAFEYIVKPFDINEITRILQRVDQRLTIAKEANSNDAPAKDNDDESYEILGQSPSMQRLYKKIGKAAGSDFTVLVTGESGTGKELVAKNLHLFSDRKDKAFVAVNSAAIPKELIESELFGHSKGAFTGADRDRVGFIEEADGGTLFLDEIGETSLDMQSKILRFLEDGKVRPVGSRRDIDVNVRFIAATNQDLKKLVAKKQFREDLYHRLNVIPIKIPKLSERVGDVELLAYFFVKQFGQGKKISKEAIRYLSKKEWPGNVRQLQNIIKRALVMSSDDILLPAHFSNNLDDAISNIESWVSDELHRGGENIHARIIEQIEAELFRQTLERCGGNKVRAAQLLGINRNTLSKKLSS